jgi:segregation and condensation protein B
MVIDKIQIVEALLFASDTPLTAKKLREIVPEVGTEKNIRKLVSQIDEKYEKQNSPYKIIELAGGYQITTRDEFASWITQLYKSRSKSKLTRKGLETLAIIAYKQPITKVEVEKIRGVNADGVIRTLNERNLITIKGREKAPGNPLLYGTTDYFLEYFGLNAISDLPKLKEIDELLKGDSKFLESLDQVALDQMLPETLGLNSMSDEDSETAAVEKIEQKEPVESDSEEQQNDIAEDIEEIDEDDIRESSDDSVSEQQQDDVYENTEDVDEDDIEETSKD